MCFFLFLIYQKLNFFQGGMIPPNPNRSRMCILNPYLASSVNTQILFNRTLLQEYKYSKINNSITSMYVETYFFPEEQPAAAIKSKFIVSVAMEIHVPCDCNSDGYVIFKQISAAAVPITAILNWTGTLLKGVLECTDS